MPVFTVTEERNHHVTVVDNSSTEYPDHIVATFHIYNFQKSTYRENAIRNANILADLLNRLVY